MAMVVAIVVLVMLVLMLMLMLLLMRMILTVSLCKHFFSGEETLATHKQKLWILKIHLLKKKKINFYSTPWKGSSLQTVEIMFVRPSVRLSVRHHFLFFSLSFRL